MRKINYKLIVSDFDGTLIDDNQKIPQKVRKAISEYVECGGVFAVCTGRMLCSILPRVRELGLKGLVIAQQGGVIADIESGRIIKCETIDCNSTAEICKEIENLGFHVNIYCGDDIYTSIPENNEYLKIYERIIGVKTKSVKGAVSDFVSENGLSCEKAACLVSESDRVYLYDALSKKLGKKFDVTCSAKVLVEVSPLTVTKGNALKYLCNQFKIPVSSSVACGDNLNDLSMIRAAGVGVAVGNATQELKTEADFIAVTNNSSAIAQIIKKYGFA